MPTLADVPFASSPMPRVLYCAASGGSSTLTAGRTAGDPLTMTTAVSASRLGGIVKLATGTYSSITRALTRNITMTGQDGATVDVTSSWIVPDSTSGATVDLSGVRTTAGTGAYATGESHMACVPSAWKADGSKMGILYLHGATYTETQIMNGVSFPALKAIISALVVAGYPVLGIYAGGDAWGNSTAKARISDGKTYLQGTLGAKAGKIGLLGGSMGGLATLNWAKDNLSSVACAAGLVPVSDVSDIHTNNRGSLAASINTAYSTWNEGTYGATYNPHTYAATGLAGLRWKAWYGATDTIVIPATVTDVVTAIGATASGVSVAGDHTTAIASIAPAGVVAYFDTYQT